MDHERRAEVADQHDQQNRIEERRLALEFERLKLDRQRASIELLLKRRELNAPKARAWKDVFVNPLTLAIVGGFITLMTTTIGSHLNASDSIKAEIAKAQQALQADLIKKFIDTPNRQSVRANLQFLVDVGLVPSYADSIQSYLKKTPDSALPSTFSSGVAELKNVHTDDDAIDLVMRLERGFTQDPRDPGGETKFGITIFELSNYLGKRASIDDLKNLSIETARDIYRKEYLTGGASQLASIQVRAAYLGLATNSGKGRAARLFQAAVSKIDKLPIDEDGDLSPATVQRMNAVDPDLLIETANCGAAKFYETLASFSKFGEGSIRRLRIFSPVTLRGICPELQPISTTAGGATPP